MTGLIRGTFFSGEGEIMKLQTVTISCTYDSIYNILFLLKIIGTFAKQCTLKLRVILIKNYYFFFLLLCMHLSM